MMDTKTQKAHAVSYRDRFEKWLAPAGAAMAMLACYGVTAGIGALSLIGISAALPFRAPVIIFFSGIAAASLAGSYKRHHSRWAVFLGLAGFMLITGSKFLPPSRKAEALIIEGGGFICMVAGNVMALRARRRLGLTCTIQRPAITRP
ncbi:MAG: MerC family mercury resistance protein [Sulfuriferula sp.]